MAAERMSLLVSSLKPLCCSFIPGFSLPSHASPVRPCQEGKLSIDCICNVDHMRGPISQVHL